MPNYCSVCGVDGTGKTTLFKESHMALSKKILPLFSPQYHLNPGVSAQTKELSQIFDKMGHTGDKLGWSSLKAISLFLSMSLTGRVLKELSSESIFLLERDPLLDVLAYAQFYIPEMKQYLGNQSLDFGAFLQPVEVLAIREYLVDLFARIDFDEDSILEEFIFSVFSGSVSDVSKKLMKVFDVPAPQGVLILSISEELLSERLESKFNSQRSKELHESIPLLLQFQQAYQDLAAELGISFNAICVDSDTTKNNIQFIEGLEKLCRF